MHTIKMALIAAVVSFGLLTGAHAQTATDNRAADRRAAANALAAFSDAIRGTTETYKQARMLDGANFLRNSYGFTHGDRYLTNAYYTALYGRDSDLKNARDWLNSYLIIGTYRFRLSTADVQKTWSAIYKLMNFESQNLNPSELTEALNLVRDTEAFGRGHVKMAEAVNRLGSALEKRTRGYWWMPLTARFEARRAQNTLRDALKF